MADKDEEIEVGGEPDKLPPEVQVITDAETEQSKAAELTPEEGVADLKAKLAASDHARAEAQQQAAQARQIAVNATAQAGASNLEMLNGSISQATQNLQILRGRYAQLTEAGDHNGAAEVMTATAAWTNHLQTLQQGKTALENQLRQPPQVQQQPIQQNPVEAIAATLTPASARWLRANPGAVNDIDALRSAHTLAMKRHAHESPGYFAAIENMLGIQPVAEQSRPQSHPQNRVEVQTEDAMSSAAQPVSQRQSAPAAAPVSRSGNGGETPRGRVRLTPDEVEAAEIAGQTPEEYYEAKTNPERYKARMRQKANGRATSH